MLLRVAVPMTAGMGPFDVPMREHVLALGEIPINNVFAIRDHLQPFFDQLLVALPVYFAHLVVCGRMLHEASVR